ncbi:hypothetical protein GCK72_005640 [Caenorhabditis remanei]|uniref:Uncharacterized protein n=1 Tax=Caenorhabditis remanei TaxID=31234 RepID=A0A6A5HFE5_CAERE|nr:hypothetical protein GCK72_005640 [Caenorhabditis remanei]KAF1765687.1 hypothetical protein GCK72_005640 [Caenorhabditis remanei]
MATPGESEFAASIPQTNPGSYEELHRKARDVFPTCFEGAKLMVNKGLSSHFQVSHTLSLSAMNTGYRFGATYVGTTQVGPAEAYPILLGDTDVNGNTTATILHQLGIYRTKLQGQIQQGKLAGAQATIERKGRLSTLGLTLANIDLVNEAGILVGQFLRRLTPRLDVGTEMVYQYGKNIPGGQISVLSYAARYTANHFIAAATLGASGVHLTYFHKQNDNLAFGVEFECNANVGEAVTTLAYQTELPEEGVTMRASFDTNWSVGGVFEKRLSQQLPFTLALSGTLNHVKAAGKFGIGLIIG